jgi:hypothetical protein
MPTYKITGPDGKVYRVTGNGTAEEAMAQVQAQVGGAPTAALAQAKPEGTVLGDLGQGLKASVDRTALGVKGLLPQSVQDWGDRADAFLGNGPLNKQTAVKAPNSVAGTVGDVGGEVLQMLAPGTALMKGANAVQKVVAGTKLAKAALPLALGIDVGGNAAVSAAMAPENRGDAAAWGAGGTAVGKLAGRVFGGALRKSVSPQAQTLMNAGIYLTPGQALAGEQAGGIAKRLRATESAVSSIPILGDVIKMGEERSLTEFNKALVNDALSGVGKKVSSAGLEGIAAADDVISKTYDNVLPRIYVDAAKGDQLIKSAYLQTSQSPLFDAGHDAKLAQWIDRRLEPMLSKGGRIDGPTAKSIDSELGELARKYNASGVGNEPLGKAFADLRTAWRTALEGTDPEARKILRTADEAFAKLLPLQEASAKTASGIFSPKQVADALRKMNRAPNALVQAGRQVLPSTVPDSGTAGRQILANMLHPVIGAGAVGGAALTGWAPAATAAAGAALAYTKPGLKGLTQGVHPLVQALRRKLGATGQYSPEMTEDIINQVIGRTTTATETE